MIIQPFVVKVILHLHWLITLGVIVLSRHRSSEVNPRRSLFLSRVPTAVVLATSHFSVKLLQHLIFIFRICLYDELDIVLEVAVVVVVVVDHTEAVGEDPHLHGSVGATGEDVTGRSHLDLHDTRPEVPEQRLASMFVWEGVERTLCGQAPDLNVALS